MSPSRPMPRRLLGRCALGAAVASLGGVAAFGLSAGGPVRSATADDPTVYTSTTPAVYTATTPTVDTSTTIDPVQAAKIAFYQATIIKPLPPAPPIRLLPAHQWSFTVPAVCNELCAAWSSVLAYNVGVWALDARARTTVIGQVRSSGPGGPLSLRLTIAPRFRSRLLRTHHRIRLVVRTQITDSAYGFVKSQQQTLTLRPR